MSFTVPPKHAGLFDEVETRFRLLLSKQVVTGISELQFDKWLTNFQTEEDRYLGARLLQNLTFRSEPMVGSAIAHILQCILPGELRRLGVELASVDELQASLAQGGREHPVRFVEVDDPRGKQPGKSGPVIMRELHRLGGIANSLMCRANDIDNLPATVKILVFVDDMLGTGTQFKTYAERNGLQRQALRRGLLYCPLAAYVDGLKLLADECAWLKVCPVEEFGHEHRFFRAKPDEPSIWATDGTNAVADVQAHMKKMCDRGGIPKSSRYALELLIGFHHATPNNTLPIMYAQTATWHHLLIR